MSKIIITVEYTYENIMEHEAEKEAEELVVWINRKMNPYDSDEAKVKSVQVIHQEDDK